MILLKINRNLILCGLCLFISVLVENIANAAIETQVEFEDFELTAKNYQTWYKGLYIGFQSINQNQAYISLNDMTNETSVVVPLFESRKVLLGSRSVEIQLLGFFNENTKETGKIVRIILNDPIGQFTSSGVIFENLKTFYQCQVNNNKTGNCTSFFQQSFSNLKNCFERPLTVKKEAVIAGFLILIAWTVSNKANIPGDLEFNNFYKYNCVDYNEKLRRMEEDMPTPDQKTSETEGSKPKH